MTEELGTFETYVPTELPEGHPFKDYPGKDLLFAREVTTQEDWYLFVANLDVTSTKVFVWANTGIPACVTLDATTVFPSEMTLILSDDEVTMDDLIGKKWEDGAWVDIVLGPNDYTLTKRQIMRALIVSGTTNDPEGFITGAIDAITDATTKALAQVDWQTAPYYVRSHDLFNNEDMLAAVNMTSDNIDMLWLLAKDQPA